MKILSITQGTLGTNIITLEGAIEFTEAEVVAACKKSGTSKDFTAALQSVFSDALALSSNRVPFSHDIVAMVMIVEPFTGMTCWSFNVLAVSRFD